MNVTPTSMRPLVAKARRGLSGLLEIGDVLNITHNPANLLSAELYDLIGHPGDADAEPPVPAVEGKQALYIQARLNHTVARAVLREASEAGREFVGHAIDSLKPVLGRSWNSKWSAAGFSSGSLRVPREPWLTLAHLEAYFRDYPAYETPDREITAEKAEELLVAIEAAQGDVDNSRMLETLAKQTRDAALATLRRRMVGLRAELDGVLSDDDARWYRFGLRRPVDGETPDLIEELWVTPGAAGQVIVEWSRARLADNYRVSWRLASDGPEVEPTEVGLFSDQMAVISGLGSEAVIVVIVTARNASGESAPAEAEIVVP